MRFLPIGCTFASLLFCKIIVAKNVFVVCLWYLITISIATCCYKGYPRKWLHKITCALSKVLWTARVVNVLIMCLLLEWLVWYVESSKRKMCEMCWRVGGCRSSKYIVNSWNMRWKMSFICAYSSFLKIFHVCSLDYFICKIYFYLFIIRWKAYKFFSCSLQFFILQYHVFQIFVLNLQTKFISQILKCVCISLICFYKKES